MLCIKCGASLTNQEYCPKCGANVKIYQKLTRISNAYYNQGLAKANVRDLSGAISDLKYSLEVYKYNTQARNLLGLIYFEMGEVVEALTEWIISKSLEPKKNMADGYIEAIQTNPARLETMNQTIKKFNQALLYCRQNSEDLAIIQLKKVLSLNPKLVKAHLLLGLLYIGAEKYDRAGREFKRVLAIDQNNTQALQYQMELDSRQDKPEEKEQKDSDVISYTSGNETIIMPASYKDNSNANIVINIIIGLVVGVALMWIGVLPAKIKQTKAEANKQVVEYSDQLSAKQASIDSLTSQLEAANEKIKTMAEEEEASVSPEEAEKVVAAMLAFNADKKDEAKTMLAGVSEEKLTDSVRALYRQMDLEFNPEKYKTMYEAGKEAFAAEDFPKAIEQLRPVVQADPSYDTGNALYDLARALEGNGDNAEAVEWFRKVVELYPRSERETYAKAAIERLLQHQE